MKKLNALIIAAVIICSVSILSACKNGQDTQETVVEPTPNTELEQTQKELAQIKQDSNQLDKYVTDLKKEINDLKIENQRLIAQNKRLEAKIIDLRLELGQIPNADAGNMLDKDAEPAASNSPAPANPAN